MKTAPSLPSDKMLERIFYLSLSPGKTYSLGSLTIDERSKIPVELPPGKEQLELEEISWEMIISAMLKILAYTPELNESEFYRTCILAVQPDIVSELTKTGIIKAEARNYPLAEEIFLALKHLAPDVAAAHLNLALLYEDQAAMTAESDPITSEVFSEKAFSVYRKAEALHADNPDLHFNFGHFFLRNQNFAQAREQFRQFLALAPQDDRTEEIETLLAKLDLHMADDQQYREAFDLIKLGRENEAIEVVRQFIERNPESAYGWFLKGWAERRLGRYDQGRSSLETCLRYDLDNVDLLNELAICCMETERFAEAVKHLKTALKLEPENTKILSNFGVIEIKRGNPAEAVRFFRTALEFDPGDRTALHYLRSLESDGDI